MSNTKQVIIPMWEYESMKKKIEDLEKSFGELESTKKYENLRRAFDLEHMLRWESDKELRSLQRENYSLKEQLKKKKSFFNWW